MKLVLLLIGILISSQSLAGTTCSNLAGSEVRWIVPNTTGSAYDTYTRIMKPGLESRLGIRILVDNIPGAGGIKGVRELAAAPPDGTTIGILNGTGILVSGISGSPDIPDLVEDLTILGRASPVQHVWVTSAASDIGVLTDLALPGREPLVFAVRSTASSSFASLSVVAHMLGLNHVFVSGYGSNRDARLALLRGEADAASADVNSASSMLQSGDLRALLQVAQHADPNMPHLENVPVLGELQQRNEDLVEALVSLLGANRLFAAPPDMNADLSKCFETAIAATLKDANISSALRKRASAIQYADGETALADLEKAQAGLSRISSIVTTAIARLRGDD